MQWGGLGQGGINPNLPGVQEVRRIRGRLTLVLEDTEFGKVYDQGVVFRLAGYLKPHWKLTLLSLIAMLVYIGTQVAVPVLIKYAIDGFLKAEGLSTAERVAGLHRVGLMFAGVVVLNLAGNFIHLRGLARVNMAVLYKLRSDMHAHLQRLSTQFFDHNEVGRLMSRVQNDTTALQEFMTIFVVGFAEVLSLVLIIVIMLWLNMELALLCFVVMPVFAVIMVFWQIRARRSFMRIRYAIAGVNASLQENITGVRVTQSMNREKVNLSQFDELNAEHLNANLKRQQAHRQPHAHGGGAHCHRLWHPDSRRRQDGADRRPGAWDYGGVRPAGAALLRAHPRPGHAVRHDAEGHDRRNAHFRASGRAARPGGQAQRGETAAHQGVM